MVNEWLNAEQSGRIQEFMNDLGRIEQSGSGNARRVIEARRVRDIITGAYEADFTHWAETKVWRWRARSGRDHRNADTLIAMGATQAVGRRGRSIR